MPFSSNIITGLFDFNHCKTKIKRHIVKNININMLMISSLYSFLLINKNIPIEMKIKDANVSIDNFLLFTYISILGKEFVLLI